MASVDDIVADTWCPFCHAEKGVACDQPPELGPESDPVVHVERTRAFMESHQG